MKMEQTKLTDEQIEAIGKAFQAVADAIREWWEKVIKAVRAAAKMLNTFLEEIRIAFHRRKLYYKLRGFYIPSHIAWWVAKIMPRRLLLM